MTQHSERPEDEQWIVIGLARQPETRYDKVAHPDLDEVVLELRQETLREPGLSVVHTRDWRDAAARRDTVGVVLYSSGGVEPPAEEFPGPIFVVSLHEDGAADAPPYAVTFTRGGGSGFRAVAEGITWEAVLGFYRTWISEEVSVARPVPASKPFEEVDQDGEGAPASAQILPLPSIGDTARRVRVDQLGDGDVYQILSALESTFGAIRAAVDNDQVDRQLEGDLLTIHRQLRERAEMVDPNPRVIAAMVAELVEKVAALGNEESLAAELEIHAEVDLLTSGAIGRETALALEAARHLGSADPLEDGDNMVEAVSHASNVERSARTWKDRRATIDDKATEAVGTALGGGFVVATTFLAGKLLGAWPAIWLELTRALRPIADVLTRLPS